MPLKAGSRLGPYEIVAPLGAGGMGEVYQARDTRLDRSVAIKILPSHLSDDESFRQRLEREARAVSSLNHPHICTLHDIGREDGIDYLVMEHLSGETLAERVKRDGPLPPEQVLQRATEIADALDKAHRQGVIHRDLKPANIMLTETGAKLLDFGLAKLTGGGTAADSDGLTSLPTEARSLTAAGSILGTFQYMAPEQLEGKEADARSDLFALGAVMFEMATGRRAFESESQASLIAAILERQPPLVSSLQPLTSPALDRVVQTCLAKNPEDRWQTAHDVMLQLRWAMEAGSQAGTPAPVAARRKSRERLAWWLAGVLALAFITAAAATIYFRSGANAPRRLVRSSIVAPPGATFQFGGDLAGPVVISPDGSHVAFLAADSEGVNTLWVRSLDSLETRRLNETDGATFPFWSADSRSLGFFADGKLKRIDADGGPALTVVEASGGRGGAWSLNDIIVYTPDFQSGLFQVSASGGTPVPLTEPDGVRHTTHRWPHFLPDGKHFLFLAVNHTASTLENDEIYIGSLDGGEPDLLVRTSTNAQYASGHLLFLRETTLMAQPFDPDSRQLSGNPVPVADKVQSDRTTWRAVFSASQDGVLVYRAGEAFGGTQVVWMDREGNVLSTVGDKADHGSVILSPDGQRAAVDRLGASDIWVHDLSRGTPTRFTFDPKFDNLGVWSPDGSEIAFHSSRGGPTFDLYRKSTTGSSEVVRLSESDKHQFALDWSTDGRLLFLEIAKLGADGDLGILPLDGGEPYYLTRTPFREGYGVFSPDSRWIAYVSDESGKGEIYVMPSSGSGGKWQISTAGGNLPLWRGDELFYWSPRGVMMAVKLEIDGDSVQAGMPERLFPVRIDPQFRSYDVSADGERFLVNTTEEGGDGPVTLVMNWTEDLE